MEFIADQLLVETGEECARQEITLTEASIIKTGKLLTSSTWTVSGRANALALVRSWIPTSTACVCHVLE